MPSSWFFVVGALALVACTEKSPIQPCTDTCGQGQACAASRCLPVDCPEKDCLSKQVCDQDQCVDKSCVGVSCAAGLVCSDGLCLPTRCDSAECAPGRVCVENQCVDSSCIGVVCAMGQACSQGYCLPTACSNQSCGPGEVCLAEVCAEAACAGVVCPTGQVCSGGQCRAVGCSDDRKNGTETDVDCGGSCPPCGVDAGCLAPADCSSGLCASGRCTGASCTDGRKNGSETDLDCGGGCPGCGLDAGCLVPSDCDAGICSVGFCRIPGCGDLTKNGTETDVDCGGASCARCRQDAGCSMDSDCTSDLCVSLVCQAGDCPDGLRNGRESDVDCGGPHCARCAEGRRCDAPSDCASNRCVGNVCLASCTDQVRNNSESDVDCGGPFCARCGADAGCGTHDDCQSDVCQGSKCQTPSCTDGVKNGSETDVDCGGACPLKCPGNRHCFVPADCAGGLCLDAGTPSLGGLCTGPTCADGVKTDAGLETDVDCGGGRCAPCVNTRACTTSSDCEYGLCNVGACAAFTISLPRWTAVDSATRWCTPSGACAPDGGEDGYRQFPLAAYVATQDTVYDNLTNITWERNFRQQRVTWEAAWRYCDGLNLGGYTDWRLPSRTELFTLTDFGRASPIDPVLFPGVGSITYGFWTSSVIYTSATSYDARALSYQPLSGEPIQFIDPAQAEPTGTLTNYARCMRVPFTAYPAQRFTAYANSQVDSITGLQWQEPAPVTTYTWSNAIAYCEGLSLDTFTDWRLPNMKELDTLTRDFAATGPTIDPVFVNPPAIVWSSTPQAQGTAALAYNYAVGGPKVVAQNQSVATRARCVRGP